MRNKYFKTLLVVISFHTVTAQVQDSLQPKIALKEITLDAIRIKTPKRIIPFALTYQTFEANQLGLPQNSLQDYLTSVPGLYAQNTQNFAQDLRLSIRGFGARSGFGIRGIQLIVDGIPETTPDGQGQLDNLPLGLIQSLTVLRGPASSFYGNASGGVIKINTLEDFEDNFVRIRAQGGSYSSRNLAATVGFKKNKTKAVIFQNFSQSEGYRDHSQYKQQVFNARIWHDISTDNQIRFQFNYTNSPYAYDAGGINIQNVQENRKQARLQNETYKTYETVDHLKTGLQWEKQINDKLSLDTYAFYAHRDFVGRLPFGYGGYVDLERNYYGLGSALEFKPRNNHLMQLRFSLADQKDHRKRFRNEEGTPGDITLDQDELFFNTALSFLDELKWDYSILRLGLRYDHQRLGTQKQSDKVNLNTFNPSLGYTYTGLGSHVLFISYSSSFETPTLNELSANPSGGDGFNPNLSPSKAQNFELGWRFTSPENTLEATLYYINTQNEILPYELENFPDRDFYRNTGKTERRGIELFWEHQKGPWEWILSYNYASLKFDNYILGENDLSGKNLPGVPQQQFSSSLQYNFSNGWGILLQTQYTGELYADDANSTMVSDYLLTNLRLWKPFRKIIFFGGVNNLLNRDYFDNVRINGFGKRYYEPAPTRNIYLGMSYNFKFF